MPCSIIKPCGFDRADRLSGNPGRLVEPPPPGRPPEPARPRARLGSGCGNLQEMIIKSRSLVGLGILSLFANTSGCGNSNDPALHEGEVISQELHKDPRFASVTVDMVKEDSNVLMISGVVRTDVELQDLKECVSRIGPHSKVKYWIFVRPS